MEGKGGSERNCEVCELGSDEGRSASEGGAGIRDIAMEPSRAHGDAAAHLHPALLPAGGLLLSAAHVHRALRGGARQRGLADGEDQGGGRAGAAGESPRPRPGRQ